MATKKIAISLPEPVLERVDKLAASRGQSRSHLIATVLDRVARAKHDRDITAQIDARLSRRPRLRTFCGSHHGASSSGNSLGGSILGRPLPRDKCA